MMGCSLDSTVSSFTGPFTGVTGSGSLGSSLATGSGVLGSSMTGNNGAGSMGSTFIAVIFSGSSSDDCSSSAGLSGESSISSLNFDTLLFLE